MEASLIAEGRHKEVGDVGLIQTTAALQGDHFDRPSSLAAELDELADPAVRLGLAVIRDAVMGSASRCVDFLREAVLQGFLAAASESLGMWFENRGAAPMAIVDEMRTHIEYAAARRQFVGLIAPAVEEATAPWSHSTRQPLNTLARLTFRMGSIVRADDVNTNLALEEG